MKKAILILAVLAFLTSKDQAQTVQDIDGNVYNTVTIGTQVWMKENLKVTHYRNGDIIPNDTSTALWAGLSTGARCYYNNDSATNKNVYGGLYNWYCVNDVRKLCPLYWHVPSDLEWTTLTTFLSGETVAGGKMKETGTNHWLTPNTGATNESNFTALPGGYRFSDGTFYLIGLFSNWWSSSNFDNTNVWYRYIYFSGSDVGRDVYGKNIAFSIRCLWDTLTTQIKEINYQEGIKIYPNPAIDRLSVDCAVNQNIKIQIFNIIGDCVFQSVLTGKTNEIDIGSLTSGIYVIRLTGADVIFQRKLIKE